MKIIKEGKKISKTMQVTCKKCEAVLEIEAKDLHFNHQDEDVGPSYYYVCPCCSRTQNIKSDDLSEEIIFDLARKK